MKKKRGYRVKEFKDRRGQWRWKVQAGNNEITGNSSGDGYKERRKMQAGLIKTAKALFAHALNLVDR